MLPRRRLSTHAYGFLITVLGVLILCPDTLLIRLVQAEGGSQWTIAFWRGVLTSIGLVVFYRLEEGPGSLRRFFRIDRWVIAAAVTMGGQALAFILSVANTAVANTLIIVATASGYFPGFLAEMCLRYAVTAFSSMSAATANVAGATFTSCVVSSSSVIV